MRFCSGLPTSLPRHPGTLRARAPRLVAQQRALAEKPPGLKRADLGVRAVHIDRELDLAGFDDVELVLDVALVDNALVVVDGNQRIPGLDIIQQTFVKGDSRSVHIAAASILAKVTRDRIMEEFHSKWPQYGFESHKGYPTEAHRKMLRKHGPCPCHRMSFRGVKTGTK